MELFDLYNECRLCPRECGVDRRKKTGFCGESDVVSVNKFLLHTGEEPCISYGKGSGTVFFNGCSLKCSFCQNMELSRSHSQNHYSHNEFYAALVNLIDAGAVNLNFVTPDHFMPHIIWAVERLRNSGYNLPIVYNCSGYESPEHLKMVADYVDIYLFDYKFIEPEGAAYSLHSPDYPQRASEALHFLHKTAGNLVLDDDGHAVRGTIVRHLVMPGFIENSIGVVNELFFEFGNDVFLSLMSQYSPAFLIPGHDRINRNLTSGEYNSVVELVNSLGFRNVYLQDMSTDNDPYLPDFASKSNFGIW